MAVGKKDTFLSGCSNFLLVKKLYALRINNKGKDGRRCSLALGSLLGTSGNAALDLNPTALIGMVC
ncbi:hypothetical protein M514_04809 [Trichuris suis]|uniref:Uncharacterized protein n=1 Tax=Trichuris suis TaxID=68888 RepID=A0A085NUN4_9BILA|nr:hypothetical protein M513_04809 [Trichuris suis]KFD73180.1 hypothetical protein M514_04809 [Trichuris suis]